MPFTSWPRRRFQLIALTTLVIQATTAQAHFVFLSTDAPRKEARLFFSESVSAAAEKLPESIAAAEIWQHDTNDTYTKLSADRQEVEQQPMLTAAMSDHAPSMLEATCTYGVYQGFLLTYYAKHFALGDDTSIHSVGQSSKLDLDIVPKATPNGLDLQVMWKRQPVASATVYLTDANGETSEVRTDDTGHVSWPIDGPGLYAARTNYVQEDVDGSLRDESYKEAHHYATLSVRVLGESNATSLRLPTLPEAIASFGGVAHNDNLFVYGGHIGTAHDHSASNLSTGFRRLNLRTGAWEDLPAQTPVQGLAIVADQDFVYRVGGMTARNATADDDADLHSTADFARFSLRNENWEELPDLPQARSSHDAVILGNTLYVTGGWQLSGDEEGEWHTKTLAFALDNPQAEWKEIEQPFSRRALAASHANEKLYVIGGMNADHEIERTVNIYDPSTESWSTGPELPGEGMNGFGVSAWNYRGSLYVSGSDGVVHRLSPDENEWQKVTELKIPRFFHQLVPSPEGGLLAVGGASRQGHLDTIEHILVDRDE